MSDEYAVCPVCGSNLGQDCCAGCAVEEVPKLRAEVERLTAALENIPLAIREARKTSPYSKGKTPGFQYGLSDGYEAAAQIADECVRAASAEKDKEISSLQAEVERLKALAEARRRLFYKWAEKRKELQAEVERLKNDPAFVGYKKMKAALEKIESGHPAGSSLINAENPFWRDAYRKLQRIARIALHEDKENG
jgi:uncharacterized small protein (DUF1192 family)